MTAVVTILSAWTMHYILTWQDEPSTFDRSSETLTQMLESFKLNGPAAGPFAQTGPKTGILSIVVWSLAAGLFFLVLFMIWRHRLKE